MKKHSMSEMALSILEAERDNLSPDQRRRLADLIGASNDVRTDITQKICLQKKKPLLPKQKIKIFSTLKDYFNKAPKHYKRLKGFDFAELKAALKANPEMIYGLNDIDYRPMDVAVIEPDAFVLADFSSAVGGGNQYHTYDAALRFAKSRGCNLITPELYKIMQEMGEFDRPSAKNSYESAVPPMTWLHTPADELESEGYAYMGRRDPCGKVRIEKKWTNGAGARIGSRHMLRVPRV